jgi:chromosome segregation ATPase
LKTRNIKERSGLIEQSGKTFSEVREDLNTAQVKLERMTAEFDHRERSFALMFGREQEKSRTLEKEREHLANDSKEVKEIHKMQTNKLELLQKEHNMFKALQKSNAEKRALLQKKVSVLENAHGVKKDIIGRLEQEINVKSKQELDRALSYQKDEFKNTVEQERITNARLQREMEDAKLNHHYYTHALLQEHDQEIMKFEEITRKFELLELELREQIEYEIVMRESVEMELCDKEAKFQQELKTEQESVVYLEQHVERVNELLESEQQRFDELEELLKEAIQGEDEEHERLRESMEEKRVQYAQLLRNEREKVAGLENAFEEAQVQLNNELQRIQEFERRESALLRTFEIEQQKLREIEHAKDKIHEELEAERRKVSDLENAKTELHAEMRFSLKNKQKEYETEQSKIKAVQQTQTNMHEVVKALNQKISQLEEEKKLAQSEGKAQSIAEERDQLKQHLDEEKNKVDELNKTQGALEKKLSAESERVKNLEEAASRMIEGKFEQDDLDLGDCPCPSEEEQDIALADLEKQLTHERTRVWDLHTEIASVKTKRDALAEKVATLEKDVAKKEKALQSEQHKYETLEQEHSKTLELLQAEREVVMAMREEYESNKALLARGKSNLEGIKTSAENTDDETLKGIEAEIEASEKAFHLKKIADDLKAANDRIKELEATHAEKSQLLEEEKNKISEVERSVEEQKSVSASEAKKIQELQRGIKSQEILLDFERERCHDLEREVSRITSLMMSEKRQVANLRDDNKQINGELYNTKRKADILEDQHFKNKDLLEKEGNKVESLTRARDQLSELLAWERSNGHSAEKLNDLLAKLSALEKDLTAAMDDLEEKEVKVQGLTEQLSYFDLMKCEVVRLSAESRRRDMMLGAVLEAIGGDAATSSKPSVQQAKTHMEDMKRIYGLDLAGLDDDSVVMDNNGDMAVYRGRTPALLKMPTLGAATASTQNASSTGEPLVKTLTGLKSSISP